MIVSLVDHVPEATSLKGIDVLRDTHVRSPEVEVCRAEDWGLLRQSERNIIPAAKTRRLGRCGIKDNPARLRGNDPLGIDRRSYGMSHDDQGHDLRRYTYGAAAIEWIAADHHARVVVIVPV